MDVRNWYKIVTCRSELTNATASVDAAYRYAYQFDDIGNRELSSERGTNSVYEANNLNQYTSVNDFVPQFDDDGNQTLVKTSTGIWQVTYNGENRPLRWERIDQSEQSTNLSSVALAKEDRTILSMSYDRLGRRVTKNDQRFVYNGYLQIADNTGNAYIWDCTEPIATRPLVWRHGVETLFYVHDGNKNVSEVIAADSTLAAHYEYAPFGAVALQTGALASVNPFRFSCEYAEDDTATVYYNYRHYEPVLGRGLVRDPIEEQGGLLIYGFGRNTFGSDRCGTRWSDWAKDLLPEWVYLLWSAKDCLVTMYNWTINMKQHVGEAYSDKFLHCYASCEFSQDCGAKVSAFLGVIKESGDLIGHSFELVGDLLFEDETTPREAFKWYCKGIVDGGTDLWADGAGLVCNWRGEECKCCCKKRYDEFTD